MFATPTSTYHGREDGGAPNVAPSPAVLMPRGSGGGAPHGAPANGDGGAPNTAPSPNNSGDGAPHGAPATGNGGAPNSAPEARGRRAMFPSWDIRLLDPCIEGLSKASTVRETTVQKENRPVGWGEAAVLPALDKNLPPLSHPVLPTKSATSANCKPCGKYCCGRIWIFPEEVNWKTVRYSFTIYIATR